MKMKELRLKTDAELATMVADLKKAVATNQFGRIFQNMKDTAAASKARKTIARILTLQAERKTGASTNA